MQTQFRKADAVRNILSLKPASWFDGMSERSMVLNETNGVIFWKNKISSEYFQFTNGEHFKFSAHERFGQPVIHNTSNINTNYLHVNSQSYFGDRTVVVAVMNFSDNSFSVPPLLIGGRYTILTPGLVDVNNYHITHGGVYHGVDTSNLNISGAPKKHTVGCDLQHAFSIEPFNNRIYGDPFLYNVNMKNNIIMPFYSVCFMTITRDGATSFSFDAAPDRISFGVEMYSDEDGQWPPCSVDDGSFDSKVTYNTLFGNVLYGTKRMAFGAISDLIYINRILTLDERLFLVNVLRSKSSTGYMPELIPGYVSAGTNYTTYTTPLGVSITVANDTPAELAGKLSKKTDPTMLLVDSKRICKI